MFSNVRFNLSRLTFLTAVRVCFVSVPYLFCGELNQRCRIGNSGVDDFALLRKEEGAL